MHSSVHATLGLSSACFRRGVFCIHSLCFLDPASTKKQQQVLRSLCAMPRWGKGRAKDDFIDDGSDDEKRGRKVAKRESDDTDGIAVCELSGHRKVTVRNFKGKVFVDIREFYTKDEKELPGKKGISLSLDQWEVLRDNVEAIDNAIKEIE